MNRATERKIISKYVNKNELKLIQESLNISLRLLSIRILDNH